MEALLPQITRQPSRKIAMRFSERARERSLLTKHGYEVSVITHQSPCQEIERVSKPIEITDRGVFVCHQRRKNIHPAYASLHDAM
jgi:hypothetical protein